MASKIVDKIVEGASELFAQQGYYGTSTREIAAKSDVTEPSIYRLFLSKEKLFQHCLGVVVERALSPAHFQAALESGHGAEYAEAVMRGVRAWYSSISAQSARLLMQAALTGNREWSEMAYAPMVQIIAILTRSLTRELELPKAIASTAARTLILALFHFKVARPMLDVNENERASVEKTIEQWFEGLSKRK